MPGSGVPDFPDPTLAPSDMDLIAISAIDRAGNLLEINPEIEWPKLTFLTFPVFGSVTYTLNFFTSPRIGLFSLTLRP